MDEPFRDDEAPSQTTSPTITVVLRPIIHCACSQCPCRPNPDPVNPETGQQGRMPPLVGSDNETTTTMVDDTDFDDADEPLAQSRTWRESFLDFESLVRNHASIPHDHCLCTWSDAPPPRHGSPWSTSPMPPSSDQSMESSMYGSQHSALSFHSATLFEVGAQFNSPCASVLWSSHSSMEEMIRDALQTDLAQSETAERVYIYTPLRLVPELRESQGMTRQDDFW